MKKEKLEVEFKELFNTNRTILRVMFISLTLVSLFVCFYLRQLIPQILIPFVFSSIGAVVSYVYFRYLLKTAKEKDLPLIDSNKHIINVSLLTLVYWLVLQIYINFSPSGYINFLVLPLVFYLLLTTTLLMVDINPNKGFKLLVTNLKKVVKSKQFSLTYLILSLKIMLALFLPYAYLLVIDESAKRSEYGSDIVPGTGLGLIFIFMAFVYLLNMLPKYLFKLSYYYNIAVKSKK